MFIFNPSLAEAEQKELTTKLENILRENQSALENSQVFGRRQLAYEINKHKEGFYYLMSFSSSVNAVVSKLKHACKIDENILRTLVVKKKPKETKT